VERDKPIDTMRWLDIDPYHVFHVFNALMHGLQKKPSRAM
jgi:carotenoid cleavage dioxygenase-like enzyme